MTIEKKHAPTLIQSQAEPYPNARRLLIVDKDAGMRHSLQRLLVPAGYEIQIATVKEARKKIKQTIFDVVLMDIEISGVAGLDTLNSIRKTNPKLPVVLITSFGTAEVAIKAMQMGAYDYILKPFDVANLKEVVSSAADVGRINHSRVVIDPPLTVDPFEDRMVGITPGMQEIYKQIGQIAATEVPLLIRGETGTGKELVARAVYQHSKRAHMPLLIINCAAIPEGLLESELFGHERGAFTDASTRRIGKFEQANKGTLFLDEIGDMALPTQAKILRVLQDGTFQRLGGSEEIEVDVRVIAATHKNLEENIEEGLFREDLYYRLNVVSVVMPPLQERKDDLPRLIDYFMRRFFAELKVDRVTISTEALERLMEHDWPGNIRELQNCLKNAILTCPGGVIIMPEDLQLTETPPNSEMHTPRQHSAKELSLHEKLPPSPDAKSFLSGLDDAWLDTLEGNLHAIVSSEMERRLILCIVNQCDNNQVHAAERLGISRSMLRGRLKRYERTLDIPLQGVT
jgi:DNA-binding NtrC family response regulator